LKIKIPKRHTLRVIRRDEFDNWLMRKTREAGIEIRESVLVKNVIPNQDDVTVETDSGTYRAKIVVGADGSNGVTRKRVLPNAPVHTARVLEILTPTESVIARSASDEAISSTARGLLRVKEHRPRNDEQTREGVAFFDFLPVPENIAGYLWDFPTQVNGQPMRCWGIYDTNLQADHARPPLKEPLAEEMARHGFDLGKYEIKGHPIRWFDPYDPLSVPRVILVGDAAGADPLFGEGISIALGYGNLAAREIQSALVQNDFLFSLPYKYEEKSVIG
jgi:flavin-dependent dehydrogenase